MLSEIAVFCLELGLVRGSVLGGLGGLLTALAVPLQIAVSSEL